MRTKTIVAAACGAVLGVATPLAAWASSAPPGSASGSVLTVGDPSNPLLQVSTTSASASGSGASSHATVAKVVLGGKTLVDIGDGSSTAPPNDKPKSGNLFDTATVTNPVLGSNPVDVVLAPWSASSTTDGTSSSSEGHTDLATANVGGASGITVYVGDSDSKASYDGTANGGGGASKGCTTTDGAMVDSGSSQVLDVAHADACSNGTGSAYVLSLAGSPILTDQQPGDVCKNFDIPSILGLDCLQVSGGNGSELAQVANLNPLPGSGYSNGPLPVGAFTAGAKGNPNAVATSAAASTPAPSPAPAPAPAAPGPATPASGSLPFTGAPLEFLAAAALALAALGYSVVRLGLVALR
ncbi:MAG TPA: hypothetical protein VE990_09360 [Acidimicrobiales bacterium]|nr:hypothetical protein [Acidimicrobiales bacterium]